MNVSSEICVHTQDSYVASRLLKLEEMAGEGWRDSKGELIKNAAEWEQVYRLIHAFPEAHKMTARFEKHSYSTWLQEMMKKNESDTGRTLAGLMVGAVVAQKKNLSIKWEFLTEAQVKTIKNTLVPGFFPFSFRDDGIDITIQSYRGTLSKEHLGDIGDGLYWYRSVSVDIIQR